ncbi:MAG: flavodoxin-dependent (E)-4-hydroxy-3-methylbut-2-enyl-diphosphate synthase [Candidatus Aminicenantes bacterium]|nr:flavodoxin-dependent (E)-4-hydroxy-3-methylbut-2-enyl-diphosphate synthase [Candidatus Aminicenantes bacterium]
MKKEIFVGSVGIGGRHPVSVQSMTNTAAADVKGTLTQIRLLRRAGCDIVRLAVPDKTALAPLRQIIGNSPLPVIADIHFDADLALGAIEAGAHGIRINPGNIGGNEKLKAIIRLAGQKKIPIRIGVNSGSLEKKYRQAGISTAQAMVKSVRDKVKFFEDQHFFAMKISLKSSDVRETVAAYRLIDKQCPYPLHLGITEAGTLFSGSIRSALGIGSLLLDGIGNTIRVSLTASPVREIRVARQILRTLGLLNRGIELISCPTCARTSVDLIHLCGRFEERVANLDFPGLLKVAIMGCEVNGPGEASAADIGLAFSRNRAFLFRKGKVVARLKPELALDRLYELVCEAAGEKKHA